MEKLRLVLKLVLLVCYLDSSPLTTTSKQDHACSLWEIVGYLVAGGLKDRTEQ